MTCIWNGRFIHEHDITEGINED